jgi:hypothetical protein
VSVVQGQMQTQVGVQVKRWLQDRRRTTPQNWGVVVGLHPVAAGQASPLNLVDLDNRDVQKDQRNQEEAGTEEEDRRQVPCWAVGKVARHLVQREVDLEGSCLVGILREGMVVEAC